MRKLNITIHPIVFLVLGVFAGILLVPWLVASVSISAGEAEDWWCHARGGEVLYSQSVYGRNDLSRCHHPREAVPAPVVDEGILTIE